MNLPANHSPAATSLNGLMILLIAVALVLPVGLTVSKAFSVDGQEGLSGYWFTRLVEDGTAGLLLNGLGLAALTTGLCLVMSVPLALLAVRCRFAGQGLLSAAVLVPLILSTNACALARTTRWVHLNWPTSLVSIRACPSCRCCMKAWRIRSTGLARSW